MDAIKNYARNHPLQFALQMFVAVAATLLFAHGLHAEGIVMANAVALPLEDVVKEFAAKSNEFKTITEELRGMGAELKAKTDGNEKISVELKDSIDKLLAKHNETRATVTDLEQKLADGFKESQKTAKTWGEQIADSEQYKSFKSKGEGVRSTFGLEVKQVTSAAAGGMIVSARETDIVNLARERRVMRDLIRTVPIATSSVDYPTQTTRTNNAAPVAEGVAAAYSDYAWGSATANVRTLAHLAKLTRQALDDAPRLAGEVDQEMRYGLGYVEERQFLYGNNTGQQLHGIMPQATAFAKPAGFVDAKGTRIDVLRLAILQAALTLFPADGAIINAVDWALIELTKDDVGNYVIGQPTGSLRPTLWGLPLVNTPAMDVGDYLVGAFGIGATIYDRMGVDVLVSTENADDFEKGLATMRAEERVAIAVKRPGVFITGTFDTDVAAIKVA